MSDESDPSGNAFDPDCPFCEIVSREDRDVREVYRDNGVVAFFPTEPAVLGHTMIIPRSHVESVWELDPASAAQIAQATVKLARVLNDTLSPDGMNIIQSNGQAASQSVPHLHVHLVPRWESDRIGQIWPPESAFSESAKDEVWAQLRAACRSLSSPEEDAKPAANQE